MAKAGSVLPSAPRLYLARIIHERFCSNRGDGNQNPSGTLSSRHDQQRALDLASAVTTHRDSMSQRQGLSQWQIGDRSKAFMSDAGYLQPAQEKSGAQIKREKPHAALLIPISHDSYASPRSENVSSALTAQNLLC
jgi:hypothetical protein